MLELAFGFMENCMDKHSQFSYVIWRCGLFTAISIFLGICDVFSWGLVGTPRFEGVLNMGVCVYIRVCVFMWACA